MMEMMIKQRKRLSPVRIELSRKINKKVVDELCGFTDLDKDHVFYSATPLDLSFVFQLQDYLRNKEELFFGKRPQYSPDLNTKESLLAQIEQKDVLLSYPYESIKPFLSMLHEAAEDESVVSIKMTYTAWRQNRVKW